MSCKDKISNRCAKKISALCTVYEGILHRNTTLDVLDCHNIEEVLEDIANELDAIDTEITLEDLSGSCIPYEAAGATLTVAEAVKGLDSRLCEVIDILGIDKPTACPTLISDCDAGSVGCEDGLAYYNFAVGSFPNTVIGTWASGTTVGDQYDTNLDYTIPKTGKYKFTVEVTSTVAVGSTGKVGVSINSVAPIETNNVYGYFSSSNILEEGLSKSTHNFVKDLVIGDSTQIQVKLASGTSFTVSEIKLIIEKVG